MDDDNERGEEWGDALRGRRECRWRESVRSMAALNVRGSAETEQGSKQANNEHEEDEADAGLVGGLVVGALRDVLDSAVLGCGLAA